MSGGSNDHPGTPTFLQIYKILSFYSILKPPRRGNCSLTNDPIEPLISMTRLKEIYKSRESNEKMSFIEEIKNKLNVVISQDDNDFTDFMIAVDHDYDLPYVTQCLMYFVTGNICKEFSFTKCDICRPAFVNMEENSFIIYHLIAQLITRDENQDPEIQHPNIYLYKFLEMIEYCFNQHCDKHDVYDIVVNKITQNSFNFPCAEHGTEVIAYIVHYYLQLRMRQYAKDYIKDLTKKSAEYKKISKLYSI